MLEVLTVYRYRTSGKLIAVGHNGYVLPLNSDLSFSEKAPHRVRRDTPLDPTPYRLEVEKESQGGKTTFRVVRSWNEDHRPPKSDDPNAPLEARIDVSPSDKFGDSERHYVGHSPGHPVGFILIASAFFLIWLIGLWGWWPPVAALVIGVLIVWLTKTEGDPVKIADVKAAKSRIRERTEAEFQRAIQDIHVWMALDGVGFERAVARIYRDQGFDVELTPRSNDQGVDLILRKNETITIVQCKAYAGNVGVSAVRELVGVRASWPQAHEAILVTLFGCSKAARAFAAQHGITLYCVARDFLKTDYRPRGTGDNS